MNRRLRAALQLATVFAVLGLLGAAGYWWEWVAPLSWDTIGDSSDPDWKPDNCTASERFARFNDGGEVATLRESTCDWGLGVDTIRYYLFVKPTGTESSRENLVLRVEVLNESTPPPVVVWASRSRLQVSYAGPVSEVTKKVSRIGNTSIELLPTLQYAGFVEGHYGIVLNPNKHSLLAMTIDLLPLPKAEPLDPFEATGDYSVFGCDSEFKAISQPLRDELRRLAASLEERRKATGQYPDALPTVSVRGVMYRGNGTELRPSAEAPAVQIVYHRVQTTYALELVFPDLQPRYQPPSEHYDSAPATAFLACTAVHTADSSGLRDQDGFRLSRADRSPPILFTPRRGVYTYGFPGNWSTPSKCLGRYKLSRRRTYESKSHRRA